MTEHWIKDNKVSSKIRLSFSKQIQVISVSGPFGHHLWQYRGYRVQVMVKSHLDGDKRMHIYWQDFENWGMAFIRVIYYKISTTWHNIKYWRYHR